MIPTTLLTLALVAFAGSANAEMEGRLTLNPVAARAYKLMGVTGSVMKRQGCPSGYKVCSNQEGQSCIPTTDVCCSDSGYCRGG